MFVYTHSERKSLKPPATVGGAGDVENDDLKTNLKHSGMRKTQVLNNNFQSLSGY